MSVRDIEGTTLPSVGTWVIDPTHTTISAVARHLMVTKVRGEFETFSGTINVAEDPADSSAALTIEAASITTGVEDRDNHLMSPDFLDVDNHKELKFQSTGIKLEGTKGTVSGDLTIRGVTKPIVLSFEFLGVIGDPFGNDKAAFSAEGELAREDWDLSWNVPLADGGVLVSKVFKLEIEAQAVLQA